MSTDMQNLPDRQDLIDHRMALSANTEALRSLERRLVAGATPAVHPAPPTMAWRPGQPLTARGAAEMAKVSEPTIRQACREGKITPLEKRGPRRSYRFSVEAVEQYIREHR